MAAVSKMFTLFMKKHNMRCIYRKWNRIHLGNNECSLTQGFLFVLDSQMVLLLRSEIEIRMAKRVPPSLLTRKSTLIMSVLAEAVELSPSGSHFLFFLIGPSGSHINTIPKTCVTQYVLNAIGGKT